MNFNEVANECMEYLGWDEIDIEFVPEIYAQIIYEKPSDFIDNLY